jgi:diguanylate cyclase (GGDEF)-like protein
VSSAVISELPGRRAADRSRDRWWSVAAWLLSVVLVGGSVIAGMRWSSDVRRERAAEFTTTASAVASSIATTLRRETDLVVVEQALVGLDPTMTNTEFTQWIQRIQAPRYVGGVGYGYVELVPAAGLAAFGRDMAADPPAGLDIASPYEVIPGGNRSQYCLLRLTVWLGDAHSLPGTLDYCAPTLPAYGASPTAAALAAARDSGKLELAAPVVLYPGVMFAFLPVYASDSEPATVADRRSQLIGWVAGTFDGKTIIADAEQGRRGLHAEVVGTVGSQRMVLASDGATPARGATSVTMPVDQDGTWWVTVSGAAVAGGLSAAAQGRVVAGLGLVIGLLVFAMIQVLVRSRGRAWRLVRQQTRELRHRALHDDLTGLPNRALIMDRLDQLLQRSRRDGIPAAVLFVDLDSFKDVNDTHGHAIGDELLRQVATRLSATVREVDTVGRLGGDEFVVLVEGRTLDGGPETVAQRVLDVLAEPFVLDALPDSVLTVRASVGVAIVGGGSPDDVLRDADMALYASKAAGKSRFTIFSR